MAGKVNQRIDLTGNQKKFIDSYWQDYKTLMEITRRVFGNPDIDGRSFEGKAVREYMHTQNYVYQVTGKPARAAFEEPELDDVQKKFIDSNYEKMSPLDMAKILFDSNDLAPMSKEKRLIDKYLLDTYKDRHIQYDSDGMVVTPYVPPPGIAKLLPLVKDRTGRNYSRLDLSKEDHDCLNSLLGYLSNYRVKSAIENYERQEDRDLFEASFIDYTIDKSDLTQGELQAYVNVCTDQVKMHKYEKQLDSLYNKRTRELREDVKVSMGITEAIDKATTQYDKAATRVSRTLKDLEGTRSERIKNTIDKNRTLLALVERMQTEEGRKKLLHIQRIQSKLVADEVEKLTNAGEEIAKVMGIHRNEIII